jgi:hypothetical protein
LHMPVYMPFFMYSYPSRRPHASWRERRSVSRKYGRIRRHSPGYLALICFSETARVEELESAGRDRQAREYNVPSVEDVEKELAVAPDLPTIKQRVQVGGFEF